MNRYFTPGQREVRGLLPREAVWHWDQMYADLSDMVEAAGHTGLASENFALMSALHAARALVAMRRNKP